MTPYNAGTIIRFTYIGEMSEDRHKEVLILHPLWNGKMHGIDLKRLTPAEQQVVRDVFDPSIVKQIAEGKKHRLPLVNDILRRMDPLEEVKNPIAFYQKFVKVFLRRKDAYRTYYHTKMVGVSVVAQSAVKGSVYNPRPLFGKKPGVVQQKKPETQGTTASHVGTKSPTAKRPAKSTGTVKQDRAKLIQQRAAALGKKPVDRRDVIAALMAKKRKEEE